MEGYRQSWRTRLGLSLICTTFKTAVSEESNLSLKQLFLSI